MRIPENYYGWNIKSINGHFFASKFGVGMNANTLETLMSMIYKDVQTKNPYRYPKI